MKINLTNLLALSLIVLCFKAQKLISAEIEFDLPYYEVFSKGLDYKTDIDRQFAGEFLRMLFSVTYNGDLKCMDENFITNTFNIFEIQETDDKFEIAYTEAQYSANNYKFSNDPIVDKKVKVIAHAIRYFKIKKAIFNQEYANEFRENNKMHFTNNDIEVKNCEIFWEQLLDYRMFKYNTKLYQLYITSDNMKTDAPNLFIDNENIQQLQDISVELIYNPYVKNPAQYDEVNTSSFYLRDFDTIEQLNESLQDDSWTMTNDKDGGTAFLNEDFKKLIRTIYIKTGWPSRLLLAKTLNNIDANTESVKKNRHIKLLEEKPINSDKNTFFNEFAEKLKSLNGSKPNRIVSKMRLAFNENGIGLIEIMTLPNQERILV